MACYLYYKLCCSNGIWELRRWPTIWKCFDITRINTAVRRATDIHDDISSCRKLPRLGCVSNVSLWASNYDAWNVFSTTQRLLYVCKHFECDIPFERNKLFFSFKLFKPFFKFHIEGRDSHHLLTCWYIPAGFYCYGVGQCRGFTSCSYWYFLDQRLLHVQPTLRYTHWLILLKFSSRLTPSKNWTVSFS